MHGADNGTHGVPAAVTAVVCVYTEDRWSQIIAAIESLQAQSLQPTTIMIVVDHNDVLLQRAMSLQGVVVVANQDARGLSGARNTALRSARTDFVAFLDDDAVAEGGWLAGLVAEMTEDPTVLGVGSRVDPDWAEPAPEWFPEEFLWTLGCSHRGLPTTRAEIRNPSGGAMVLRRRLIEDVGGYRTDLGRLGKRPLGCEETEYCLRATSLCGGRFLYQPAVHIKHHVPADRATWRYFRQRCYGEGLSKAIVAKAFPAQPSLATERQYVSRTLTAAVGRGVLEGLRGRHDGFLRAYAVCLGLAATSLGFARGYASRTVRS